MTLLSHQYRVVSFPLFFSISYMCIHIYIAFYWHNRKDRQSVQLCRHLGWTLTPLIPWNGLHADAWCLQSSIRRYARCPSEKLSSSKISLNWIVDNICFDTLFTPAFASFPYICQLKPKESEVPSRGFHACYVQRVYIAFARRDRRKEDRLWQSEDWALGRFVVDKSIK